MKIKYNGKERARTLLGWFEPGEEKQIARDQEEEANRLLSLEESEFTGTADEPSEPATPEPKKESAPKKAAEAPAPKPAKKSKKKKS